MKYISPNFLSVFTCAPSVAIKSFSGRCGTFIALVLITCLAGSASTADHANFICGADISALPMMEKAGGIYRDHGKPEDAIAIFRSHGCNLFRIRLFVDPQTDAAKSFGAIQNLPYVIALANRVKAAGGKFLLDIHYSDTWADPGKQFTPKQWEHLDFEAMKNRVGEYTTTVLRDLDKAGVKPDMVQVGNEITSGMLWPTGKVWGVPPEQTETQWIHFAALFNAGAAAVRKFDGDSHSMRIVLHIDGGGKAGRTKWFLNKIAGHPFDYDVLGLSFYPAWGDSLDVLKQNLSDAISLTGKDVLIAETSYPWHALPDIPGGTKIMRWLTTPIGQKAFLADLIALLKSEPGGHGLGFVYWYPEAISLPRMRVWRQGYEALFDQDGNALPALGEFKAGS